MYGTGTFSFPGEQPFPGLVLDESRVIDLSGYGWESVEKMLRGWSTVLAVLDNLAVQHQRAGDGIELSELQIHQPIAPTQILQSGANFRKHVIDIIIAEEMEAGSMTREQAQAKAAKIMDDRIEAGEPYIFLGAPSAVSGPNDEIVLPRRGRQHDWELELAAVVGVEGRHIPRERALEHVAGYTIANDLTTRDVLYRPDLEKIGTDWLRAKNAPTFLPVGPWIVPAEFIADPQDLTITLTLNGEVMQNESTSDMIFDVATLVSYASSLVPLRPGDLILTGSPAGNGMHHRRFLKPGDTIESTITHLGRQHNVCVAEQA